MNMKTMMRAQKSLDFKAEVSERNNLLAFPWQTAVIHLASTARLLQLSHQRATLEFPRYFAFYVCCYSSPI